MASSENRLVWRAVLAFLALPGVVAFLVPYLIALPPRPDRFRAIGLVPLVPGLAGLVWCAATFVRSGRGTLAPWDPPQHLVVAGPYRWSRNPMYVSVALVLAGWAVAFGSAGHAAYATAVVIAFHLRVVFGEEPWLARRHGEAWDRYAARVPRWVGRVRSGGDGGLVTEGTERTKGAERPGGSPSP